ncbi:hypothetical protein E1218_08815 [Kribbella turkmenica]|uniref:Carbohydrate kinase PfkB domain-containing protein n=1 Tax=Kribbella turkmenica TaxID=2530375 RepID=A0A4V2YGQ2_9ACTN|nr:PfkB family carbohydrate kinase [Kribbella turkmenica]TDD27887.1 hypothetical protein E1218_08815 [Kribbella turkmenica]
MLLIVGEPIVAYQRDVTDDAAAAFSGPWPSGSPAICAYVAARLGLATTFVGAVGADRHGEVMREGLRSAGVDVSHLAIRADEPTAWARITYRGGERTFEFHVDDSAATTVTSADLGELPERARWLHLSGSALIFGGTLPDAAFEALERARRSGARVSVDPNVRPESLAPELLERLRAAIRAADVVLPSAGELGALGIETAELTAAGAVVCVTDSKNGATVHAPGHPDVRVPVEPVAAVDTDGAGDSFAAGFIAAAADDGDPVTAARFGAQVAAAAIAEHGPMTATFQGLQAVR